MKRDMRKLKVIAFCVMCVMLMASCDDEKIITVDQLPVAAQSFIKKSYSDKTVVVVKKDSELFSTKYEVVFGDGMKVEFDGDGMPIDVDVD